MVNRHIDFILGIMVVVVAASVLYLGFHFSSKAIYKNCVGNTTHATCSKNQPYYCYDGLLSQDISTCGCPKDQINDNNSCRYAYSCKDNTNHGACSQIKPFFCYDGVLLKNASLCGCPGTEIYENNNCRTAINCSDGTIDTKCSQTKPLYCYNGTLLNSSGTCGCPAGYKPAGGTCFDPYPFGFTKTYSWYYKSKTYTVELPLSKELYDHYSTKSKAYYCYGTCPDEWEVDYLKGFIFEEKQRKYLQSLINSVNESNDDKKLKVLLTFVQSIPYDSAAFKAQIAIEKYPYETLYENLGVCEHKSLLGAAIAAEMGYGVVLFTYDSERHMALGLKCPNSLSNYNSGYCFIETTSNCSRLTDNKGTYAGGVTLASTPEIYYIKDGKSLSHSSVMEDINDVKNFEKTGKRLKELDKLLDSTTDISLYNSYVAEYNNNVVVYNSFLNCS